MDEQEKKAQEEIYKNISNENSINSSEKYVISFSVNSFGVVDVQVDWPDKLDPSCEESIAYLMYAISSGNVKKLSVQALNESVAVDNSLIPNVQSILEKWFNLENEGRDRPFISPLDTLK